MSNLAGLVIIAAGVLVAIIAIKGTQKAVLPALFGAPATTTH
jgi:hypothetical protein